MSALVIMLVAGPVQAGEQDWYSQGSAALEAAKKLTPVNGKARNVIFFVGDGMSMSTVTAARILEGQLNGGPGEDNVLSFERLPYLALSKTYSANQQTPDSAPTMSAMVTGVKTNDGVFGFSSAVKRKEKHWNNIQKHRLVTLLELAETRGLSTGVVTTARLTHATPAACYAHTSEREWESDADLPMGTDVPDIARQLLEFSYGDGLEVAMGGGRREFLPVSVTDGEGKRGRRKDHRDLTREWLEQYDNAAYVWNSEQFHNIDAATTDHLLGLFEASHMEYEADRADDKAGEPSLTEMTEKAIQILSKNPKGYFLQVESGRIDHGHHATNAYRALTDTIEFSNAVRRAMELVDPAETLIIVTADHSHVFTMGGYPKRGNPILGTVVMPGKSKPARAADGKPYTTLSYTNGRGFAQLQRGGDTRYRRPIHRGRADLNDVDTTDEGFHQEALVPLAKETHSGEDVAIYAGGPMAHLFHGVQEQHYVFHVMAYALGLR
jgi:alkaline phosphatase